MLKCCGRPVVVGGGRDVIVGRPVVVGGGRDVVVGRPVVTGPVEVVVESFLHTEGSLAEHLTSFHLPSFLVQSL